MRMDHNFHLCCIHICRAYESHLSSNSFGLRTKKIKLGTCVIMTDAFTRETQDQGFNWATLGVPPLTCGYGRMTGRTGILSACQGPCYYTSAGSLPCYTTQRSQTNRVNLAGASAGLALRLHGKKPRISLFLFTVSEPLDLRWIRNSVTTSA